VTLGDEVVLGCCVFLFSEVLPSRSRYGRVERGICNVIRSDVRASTVGLAGSIRSGTADRTRDYADSGSSVVPLNV
jgi:hypothetical protein